MQEILRELGLTAEVAAKFEEEKVGYTEGNQHGRILSLARHVSFLFKLSMSL